MRKVRIGLFLLCLVGAASAQDAAFVSVCENLAKHPNMTGNFTQVKTISAANRSLKSSGTFIFSLEGIMWKTEKPFPSVLVVGLTSVIQTLPDGRQTVTDASSNQIFTSISSTLFSMFSGDARTLDENFNVEFSASGAAWKAVLKPKDSAVSAVMASIAVSGTRSAASAELNEIVMTEGSGDTITYTFTNQNYPEALTDDEKAYFIAK